MKRLLAILVLALSAAVSVAQITSVQVTADNYDQLSVSFTSGQLQSKSVTIAGQTFVSLSMDDLLPSQKQGIANLPTYSTLIEVPLCQDFAVEVRNAHFDTIDLLSLGVSGVVAPLQPSRSKSDTSAPVLMWNKSVYETDLYMGADLAQVERVGIARDRNLARLQISPVRYNAVQGKLIVCRSADISVRYIDVDRSATDQMFRLHHSPAFKVGSTLNSLYPKEVSSAIPIRYLIVSHSMFQGQLDNFVNWKRRKGFLVDVVYTSNPAVGTTTASISSYIHSQYTNATPQNPAPTYVLLVGDHEQIPAYDNQTAATSSGSAQHVTDLYFMTWTAGDHVPDCYYGRFSAQSVAQLTPQIQKTLMYEQYTFADPAFLDRAVMVAGVDGGSSGDYGYTHADPAMDYAITNYVNGANGYSDVRYFKNNTSIVPTATNVYLDANSSSNSATVRNYYNQGAGWINYSAHGSATSWGTPNFTTTHASSMTNTQKFGLMIGNCCLTNKFETTTCLGEALLRKSNYCGAVGYIGGSNSTYWYEDFYWAVGLRTSSSIGPSMSMAYNANNLGNYDRMCHTHGEAHGEWVETQGGLVLNGDIIVESGTSSSFMKHYYWEIYHLMGDPSVMPYHTQASAINIVASSALPAGTQQLSVQAVPFAYVALTDTLTHSVIDAAYANASGQVVLSLPANLSVGGYEIAASAQNYRTSFAPLSVIAPNGPYVVARVPSATPVAGSTLWLGGTVVNLGTEQASDVSVQFSSDNDQVSILSSAITIPSIPAGDSVVLDSMLAISLLPTMEDMTYFNINASANYNNAQTPTLSPCSMQCYAPKIEVVFNNAPDYLMPSSHHQFSVSLTNTGHAALQSTPVELFCPIWHVAVTPSSSSPLALAPGASSTRQYTLDVNSSIPINIVVPFQVRLQSQAPVLNGELLLSVGLPVSETFEGSVYHLSGWSQNTYPWIISNTESHLGTCSARSAVSLGHSQTSQAVLSRNISASDSISFWFKISSEANYDKFYFSIDNTEKLVASGSYDWARVAFPVSAGNHTFTFSYQKDGSVNSGSDCVWIDDIQLPQIMNQWVVVDDTVCFGEQLIVAGDTIDTHQPGDAYATDASANPIVFTHYTILPQLSADSTISACDSYAWNDTVFFQPADFSELVQGPGSCPMLMNYHLVINHSTLDSIQLEVSGNEYVWNESVYTASGVYTQTLTTAEGCDSVVVLTLTLKPSTQGIESDANLPVIKAYPNPTMGILHLSEPVSEAVVYDLMGRKVLSLKDVETISLTALAKGLYTITLKTSDGYTTQAKITLK